MTKNSWIIICLFFVRVNIPFGFKQNYDNVRRYDLLNSASFLLTLEDGKQVIVPAAFTIIEEK